MKSRLLLPSRSRRSEPTRRSRWFRQSVALLALAGLPYFAPAAQAANTEDDFIGAATGNVTTATNYGLLAVPTVTNDFVFPGTAATGIRNFGGGAAPTATNLTVGSLNDLSVGTTVSIANASTAASTVSLTLGGAGNLGNSVSGTVGDLLFVTTGGTLNLNAGTTSVLNVVLGQSGNFNVAGAAAISSVISDGGSNFGITKTGVGTLTLSGANTFGGGLNLNAGTVSIAAANNLGTGNVSFGGGTLAITTAAVDPSAQFSQAANQAYNINSGVATTFATALTSSGGTLNKLGAGTLTSTVANTFTGSTTLNGGSIALSGAGSLASTTINLQSANGGGGLLITNTGAGFNAINRVADAATINIGGGSFVLGGSDQVATNVSETVGSFVMGKGAINGNTSNIITVSPGTGATAGTTTLTATTGVTRAAGSLMALVNGTGLGSSATSTAQFFAGSTPALVGTTAPAATGINATSQNTQIVTGLVGEATATTGGLGTSTNVANTFVTYTAGGGFRPLNPTDEFTNNAFTTGNNTRITTAATTLATATTVNSLISGASFVLNAPLTVTSGMTLFAATSTISGTGGLAFGATEGQFYVNTGLTGTISAPISGSNGFTVSGLGSLVISGAITNTGGTITNTQHFLTLSGANTLTGTSIVSSAGNGGIFFISNTGAVNGASSIQMTNSSQLRITAAGGATAATFASPITYGDGVTAGNLYVQSPANNSNVNFTGTTTLNSPVATVLQSFNAGSNQVAFNGITSTANGTGGVDFQVNGGTGNHLFSVAGTLNYTGPTILEGNGTERLALIATTLPSATTLTFLSNNAKTYQFDLNGNAQTVAGLITTGVAGLPQVINSNATASSLTVSNTVNNYYAGTLGTVGATAAGTTPGTPTGTGTGIILAAGTSNNFSLTKTGSGTLTLAGAGSYTGGTTINGGRLLITNATALGTGGVTIGTGANAGALATGPGALTVANLITTSGTGSTLSPGATATTPSGAVGMLTLSAGLNLAAGGTIPFDIASTTALSDVINVTGGTFTGATGTGSGNVAFAFNSLGAVAGTTYTLINFTGSTLADTDLSDFSFSGVSAGNFAFNVNGANELDFTVTAVPEPSTYVGGLFMLGALGWSLRGRFARRSA